MGHEGVSKMRDIKSGISLILVIVTILGLVINTIKTIVKTKHKQKIMINVKVYIVLVAMFIIGAIIKPPVDQVARDKYDKQQDIERKNKIKEKELVEKKKAEEKAIKDEIKRVTKEIDDSRPDISRIQFAFIDFGFRFKNSPLQDGTSRSLGMAIKGKGNGTLELYDYGGKKLRKATLVTFYVDNPIENNYNLNSMVNLLDITCPEFNEMDEWLKNSLEYISNNSDKKVTKKINNKTITLSGNWVLGAYILDIEVS